MFLLFTLDVLPSSKNEFFQQKIPTPSENEMVHYEYQILPCF